MALVPAKCTQCGGSIEVDDTHEAGICKFCGTPFITEKAINNYNTFITNNFAGANINIAGADLNNLIILAKNAEEVNNYEEANRYYSRALEMQPKNCEALVGKGVSALYCSNLNDIKSDELIGYISKALEYKKNEPAITSEELNEFTIKSVGSLYDAAIVVMAASQTHYNEFWKYEESAPEYWDRLSKVIKIFLYIISLTEDSKNDDSLFYYKESIKFVITCCIEICKQRQYVSEIVNPGEILETEIKTEIKPVESLHQTYLELYDNMCKLIKNIEPDYVPEEINKTMQIKGGCYIATCVYGSYDCPQVWTLRRFRDYTLDETWYGRLFIKCYYAVSPKLVKWFGGYNWFRKPWKIVLDGMVERLKSKGVADTKYNDKY